MPSGRPGRSVGGASAGAGDTRSRHAEECPRGGLDSSTMSTEAAPRNDPNYVHLHVHREYSMLAGAARSGVVFSEGARMGMADLEAADQGSVFGAYECWK